MQTPWNQYTLPLQRPRLQSDVRPHTVHASSSPSFVNGVQEAQQQQYTPRASLANLGILPEAAAERRLSRDDTANSVSELMAHAGLSNFSESDCNLTSQDRSNTWHSEDIRPGSLRATRQARKSAFRLPSTFSASSESSSAGSSQSASSLGRRFSKTARELRADLKENAGYRALQKMRRQSTPQDIDAATQMPKQILPVPPTSPSKRNGKHEGDRPTKLHRHFLKQSEIRKDTPAPSAFGPARPRTPARPLTSLPGGDRARQAAAASKVLPQGFPEACEHLWAGQEDLDARRGRLLSLSSAADSGADLSSYDGSNASTKDSDGDVEMSSDDTTDKAPVFVDPASRLPSELMLQIFQCLDVKDLCSIERVSSSWKKLADDTSVWRNAFLRKYERRVYTDPPSIQVGGIGCGRTNRPNQEWKRMYKARVALEKNWRAGPKDAGKAVYLSGHTDSVYCVQFDEEKIITGSRDRTIRVWDINNFTCKRVIGGPNTKPTAGPKVLRTVDYPDFHIATASVNGTAYGETIFHTPSQWHDASILCLQYDEQILVTGSSDSDLLVWDINTYEPIKRLQRHSGGVLDVALDGKHIVSCSKDSRIIVWDRSTFEAKGELTGHRGPVNAVQLRGKYLVSASGDGIARLWDIEAMKLVKEFSAKERGLAAVEFSEDMKYVLAGGNDTITYKFEVETGKEVKTFEGHTQLVRSLWLDSQNSRVVSGSYDLDLRVYDFDSGEEIWRAEEWTTSWMLAAKSDYRRIVATSQDGRILIIDFGLQKCRSIDDGQPIPGVDLLRGLEHTSIIEWRDPWKRARDQEKERRELRMEKIRSQVNIVRSI